jgi:hypothetical protein
MLWVHTKANGGQLNDTKTKGIVVVDEIMIKYFELKSKPSR